MAVKEEFGWEIDCVEEMMVVELSYTSRIKLLRPFSRVIRLIVCDPLEKNASLLGEDISLSTVFSSMS